MEELIRQFVAENQGFTWFLLAIILIAALYITRKN
jgi:hypothetical protein